jgi:hypothetical protein
MKRKLFHTLTLVAVALSMAGCATTHQTRSVKATGFLTDYSNLRKGTGKEAQLLYVDSDATWKTYKKLLIDPVRVCTERGSKLHKLSAEDRQALVDYLDSAMRRELMKDYEIVGITGLDVLRIRMAISDARASKIVMDTTSNILPPMVAVSALKRLLQGTNLAVGDARLEFEALDSMTGRQLGAGIDHRAGAKTFKGKFDKWSDTKSAFDYWAERLRDRLAKLR